MSKLGKKLRSKHVELVLIVIFLLYSLRVINWFEYPYIIVSGDFRPPLIREAFTSRVLSTWDEIDFGTPSVYSPRILDPIYFFITVSQTFGANLYLAQIIGVFLIYFLGSLFTYVFIKQLANGDTIAGFIGAIFVTSNLHLISDREQTAIGFLDMVLMILPCLVTFTRGINVRSYKLMALSGLLFVLTYGTFPNYRASLICLIMIALICLYFFVERGVRFRWLENKTTKFLDVSFNTGLIRTYLRYLCVFIISILLASIWIISLVSMNSQGLVTAYNETTAPAFLKYLKPYDVLRLIAKWSFYEGALESPYVPYASVYMSNPLIIILSYLPPILAFTSLLMSKRKLTFFFSVIAVASLILTGAFNPGLSQLYSALATNVPLMIAFRESTHWIFFAILSYAILIGVTVSSLYRKLKNRKLQMIAIGLVIALLAATSYPLITGEVSENWLDPQIKGSYLPLSYGELNDALSNDYWCMLLPARQVYVVYNFTEGPFSSGNPYPLIFSKPVVSGVGTEYVQSENLDLITRLHELILTSENIASEGKISASSVEDVGFEPDKAVDGLLDTRWSSGKGVPQWLEIDWNETQRISGIRIMFEAAYAEDCVTEIWSNNSWVTQVTVKNSTSSVFSSSFLNPIETTRLRLYFTRTTDRFPSVSIYEFEIYAQNQKISSMLGMMGIKYLVLEKDIVLGNTYDLSELHLNEIESIALEKEWDEFTLYSNGLALQKLYVSDNTINYTTLDDMRKATESLPWDLLKHSAFLNSTSVNPAANETLALPDSFVWTEDSPTSYEVHAESKGAFLLAFLESYDRHWKLYINGSQIAETSHLRVNAYANGWLIKDTGELSMKIEYETQSLFTNSIIASVILSGLLLIFFSRKELAAVTRLFRRRLRRDY